MKRKRDEIIGDDGELLSHFDEKAKRGEPSNTLRPSRLVLPIVVVIFLGAVLIITFNVLSTTTFQRTVENANITAVPTHAIPTEMVDLAQVAVPTLPPQWTAAPTETVAPSITPENTLTPTHTPELRERIVTVSALGEWQSGQTIIRPGEVVEIEYVEGLWESWPGVGMAGPDGRGFHTCIDTDEVQCVEPLSGYSQAGMIGRVGDDGEMFGIGYKTSFVAETGGELQLRINDRDVYDNSGAITMRITVKRYND